MRHIHVNGVDLEYMDIGAGVPVVFSHGGSSDIRYWEPQRESFARDYRLVAYSHRSHGIDPPAASGAEVAEANVADLVAIIEQLGAGPVHLVGFSTAIALRAAVRAPDLVRSLTIIEPNVPWLLEGDPVGESVLAWWREENDRIQAAAGADDERRAKLWFELVNNRGPGTFDDQPEGLRRMWLENFQARRPGGPAPEALTCEHLRAITAPTLAIGAGDGMRYSRRIVERLPGCIPGSRLQMIPSVTHFMSYQQPAVFNEVVLDFIGRH